MIFTYMYQRKQNGVISQGHCPLTYILNFNDQHVPTNESWFNRWYLIYIYFHWNLRFPVFCCFFFQVQGYLYRPNIVHIFVSTNEGHSIILQAYD